MPRVTVLDYGFGNVRSAVRALEHVGAEVTLTADRETAAARMSTVPGAASSSTAIAPADVSIT